MKIFISWSGERSRLVADFMRKWIKQVLQGTDPWISTDIEKGKSWGAEIHKVLSDSKFGIVCLTKENLESKWIHFEAGAIAKSADGNVFTFLLDIDNGEVKQPLGQFQHTRFQKEDVFKLIHDINNILQASGGAFLSTADLQEVFATNWPRFSRAIKSIADIEPETEYMERSPEDMIEEVLMKTRDLDLNLSRSIDWIISKLSSMSNSDSFTPGSYSAYGTSDVYRNLFGRPMWNEHIWMYPFGKPEDSENESAKSEEE